MIISITIGSSSFSWVEPAITLLAVLLAFALALWGEFIKKLLWKPKLNVKVENRPPYCHSIPITNDRGSLVDCYYFRTIIENNGNVDAENVEVWIDRIMKKDESGYNILDMYSPLRLLWAHFAFDTSYSPRIAPKTYRLSDLGRVVDPDRRKEICGEYHSILKNIDGKTSFRFSYIVSPNNGTYVIGPGDYILKIIVSASNVKAKTSFVKLAINGEWLLDERDMLNNNVIIEKLKTKDVEL